MARVLPNPEERAQRDFRFLSLLALRVHATLVDCFKCSLVTTQTRLGARAALYDSFIRYSLALHPGAIRTKPPPHQYADAIGVLPEVKEELSLFAAAHSGKQAAQTKNKNAVSSRLRSGDRRGEAGAVVIELVARSQSHGKVE